MKKVLSVILSLAMIFSMSMPALAAEYTTVSMEKEIITTLQQRDSTGASDKFLDDVYPVIPDGSGTIIDNGTCGTGLIWELDENGLLTISGTGIISDKAFYNNDSILDVVIEEGVSGIGMQAFSGCDFMETVTIPTSMKTISANAFYECSSLNSVYISDLKSWCEIEFELDASNPLEFARDLYVENQLLTELIIPEGITKINNYAFSGCSSIDKIVIPEGVTSIGYRAFNYCEEVDSLTLPSTLTSVNNNAFDISYCSNIYINNISMWCKKENAINFLNEYNLYLDNELITDITIPADVTEIRDEAFYNCSNLENITITEGIKKIGLKAFYNCVNLERVTIPKSVTIMGFWAFGGCQGLSEIYFQGNAPIVISNDSNSYDISYVLHDIDTEISIYYPVENATWNEVIASIGNTADDGNISLKWIAACLEEHNWNDNYTVDEEATCTEDGRESIHCEDCEETRDEKIVQAVGHNSVVKTIKATTSKHGTIGEKCSECGYILSHKIIHYPKTITISKTKYTYSGKTQKPKVTVKGSDGKTISAANYTVNYSRNSVNVGKYTVKITFKGNYSGTILKTYTIVPKGTSLSSVRARSKGFTVKWKKQTTQVTGYQIQYSTNSKFINPMSVTIRKNSTVTKAITKRSAKKKYYVRVRTYKTVNKTNYYSSWSSVKHVTTKK